MVLMLACAPLTSLHAQALRDPTQAPPEARATQAEGAAVSVPTPWGDEGVAMVVRGGKPFLVSGTRLYGVGQKLGAYRIERISETEVWLRHGTELHKVPGFAGVQRRPVPSASECVAGTAKPSTPSKPPSPTSPKAASCTGAQP